MSVSRKRPAEPAKANETKFVVGMYCGAAYHDWAFACSGQKMAKSQARNVERGHGVVGLAHRSREVDRKAKTRAGRSTQEETRRGRVGAMHVVAAARTFWVCGTEKCPCEFATDGVCGGS